MLKIQRSKTDTLIEKIGLKYFFRLSKKVKSEKIIKLKNIPSDRVIQVVSQNITLNAVIIAFLVGALTTIPAVIFELYFKEVYSSLFYYVLLAFITVLFLVMEVGILYWLGIRSAYTLSALIEDESHESHLPPEYNVRSMMVRSALELEDPVVEYLGIDPQKYVSKKWLLIRALLYKAKIALTSILLRILLRKVAVRFGMRIEFIWVVIPVTAFWDAFVMYRVIRDAKMRLFGYHLSRYISEEIMSDRFLEGYSPLVKEGAIRAISTIMVFSKNYHPNNVVLLIRLSQNMNVKEAKDYDDLSKYMAYLRQTTPKEKHLLRLLSGIAAVFDGHLSRDEKKVLSEIYGDQYKAYMAFTESLKSLLLSGAIHQAAALCEEQFHVKYS